MYNNTGFLLMMAIKLCQYHSFVRSSASQRDSTIVYIHVCGLAVTMYLPLLLADFGWLYLSARGIFFFFPSFSFIQVSISFSEIFFLLPSCKTVAFQIICEENTYRILQYMALLIYIGKSGLEEP